MVERCPVTVEEVVVELLVLLKPSSLADTVPEEASAFSEAVLRTLLALEVREEDLLLAELEEYFPDEELAILFFQEKLKPLPFSMT